MANRPSPDEVARAREAFGMEPDSASAHAGPTPERWAELEARGREMDDRHGGEPLMRELFSEVRRVSLRNTELEAALAAVASPDIPPEWDIEQHLSDDLSVRSRFLSDFGRVGWMLATTVVMTVHGTPVFVDTFMRQKV